jgi:hypothetical protein
MALQANPERNVDVKTSIPDEHLNIEDIIDKSRRDIGKIDRDLRKDHPKLFEPRPDSVQSMLEHGIAAAGRARVYKTETMLMSDGRLMTKVIGSFGARCYITRGVGDLDGIDHIQRGMGTVKAFPCSN